MGGHIRWKYHYQNLYLICAREYVIILLMSARAAEEPGSLYHTDDNTSRRERKMDIFGGNNFMNQFNKAKMNQQANQQQTGPSGTGGG